MELNLVMEMIFQITILEPLIEKRVSPERLTHLSFHEDCFLMASQDKECFSKKDRPLSSVTVHFDSLSSTFADWPLRRSENLKTTQGSNNLQMESPK